jgi:hypothetical protein
MQKSRVWDPRLTGALDVTSSASGSSNKGSWKPAGALLYGGDG